MMTLKRRPRLFVTAFGKLKWTRPQEDQEHDADLGPDAEELEWHTVAGRRYTRSVGRPVVLQRRPAIARDASGRAVRRGLEPPKIRSVVSGTIWRPARSPGEDSLPPSAWARKMTPTAPIESFWDGV